MLPEVAAQQDLLQEEFSLHIICGGYHLVFGQTKNLM